MSGKHDRQTPTSLGSIDLRMQRLLRLQTALSAFPCRRYRPQQGCKPYPKIKALGVDRRSLTHSHPHCSTNNQRPDVSYTWLVSTSPFAVECFRAASGPIDVSRADPSCASSVDSSVATLDISHCMVT